MQNDQIADFSRYDGKFYGDGGDLAFRAAQIILAEIAAYYDFRSVVDLGCGAGGWLRAATLLIQQRDGATPRVLGIDGPYAEKFAVCAGAEFRFQNLEARVKNVGGFDLAISMEVAEHLTPGRASTFVEDLAESSDVVLFSAAIPGQGGDNHINEQWQSYWVRKFAALGYRSFDVLRSKFWGNELLELCPFYVCNGFLHVRSGHPLEVTLRDRGTPEASPEPGYPTDVVHPKIYSSSHFEQAGPRKLLASFPRSMARALSNKVKLRQVGR